MDEQTARHWCGKADRHHPHIGCNGFGYWAGPPEGLCRRRESHPPHTSCDGRGVTHEH